ncbi:glutamate racemase [Thalassotalea euphylliae]|uniref:glutamate racemase n=1 Tax=Thalassotalea euphylliae TaxID=1655234 RepID=UPI00363A78BD
MAIDLLTQPEQAPIGIFDSGIGGISIARCISEMLPNEQLIYVADSGFAPYGDKSNEEIIARVHSVAKFLINQGVKAIVVACNTATVIAIESLRKQYQLPIIGVEPAIKPAALVSKAKSVGILVTQATANNPRFLELVDRHKLDAEVHIQPCPGLVQQIEQGQHHSEHCNALLSRYITPLVLKGIDTLVLGCTHYPLISQQIQQHLPTSIELLETAKPVTQELKRRLLAQQLLNSTEQMNVKKQVYSSAFFQNQQYVIEKFWPTALSYQQLSKDV